MDLALALVEEDHGSRLALQVARNLVLYLRRPGGQSQFSAALSMQLTDRKPLRELESWVLDNLNKPLNVPVLAERVAMSPRNFARVFTKEMKTTPEVCGAPARRSSSPATGRKSKQPGNNCRGMWLWERQFDAQRFPAGTENCTWAISSSLSK